MLNAVDLIAKGILEEKERQEFIDEQGIMNGYTRLIDAASFGRTDVITLLLDNRADKSIKGFNGLTAYEAAVRYNEKGIGEKIPDHVLERLRT
jgi:ankyrin repeat protein